MTKQELVKVTFIRAAILLALPPKFKARFAEDLLGNAFGIEDGKKLIYELHKKGFLRRSRATGKTASGFQNEYEMTGKGRKQADTAYAILAGLDILGDKK